MKLLQRECTVSIFSTTVNKKIFYILQYLFYYALTTYIMC